ncbi:MAG: DUF294 nucleotidyltransferase-like domain-containing protein [Puniceicoccaceae bacterium]
MLKLNDPLYRRIRNHANQAIRLLPEIPAKDRLKAYKQFLKLERQMIARHHRKGDSGLQVARCGAVLVDVMLESIMRTAVLTHSERQGTLPCQFALLGLGGYGRGELNPLSDVDIMFLFPDKANSAQLATMKQILTDEVLYPMWDLGFKVGHSTRSVKECIDEAQADYKTRNSLLESRRILGSATVHQEMEGEYRRFLDSMDIRPYLEEMIQMQEDRRSQYGGSVFAPEPNVKNGVGGLRDYQGVQWLLHLMYGRAKFKTLYTHDNLFARDMREFEEAYDFQLRVRSELHFNSRRATDELTLSMQRLAAVNLGYQGNAIEQVEHLMKDYYFHARNSLRVARSVEQRVLETYDATRAKRRRLFRLSVKKVQRLEVDGFVIESDRISVANETDFMADPMAMLRLFELIQAKQVKPTIDTQRLVAANLPKLTGKLLKRPDFCCRLAQLFTQPGRVFPVLEEMYNAGFLARVIPEFEMLHCLVQHDHFMVRYAEDQKVLKSIQRLDAVVCDPQHRHRSFLPEPPDGASLNELYWILLLFSLRFPGLSSGVADTPMRKGADVGAILKRLQVEPEMAKRILTFIDKHRNVARFWQRVDPDDSRFIQKIANILNDHETARFSIWFHYCDSLGRNAQYWQVHSLETLSSIYSEVIRQLELEPQHHESGNATTENRSAMTRMEIKDQAIPGVGVDEIDAHFQLLPVRYFETRSVEDVELHISLVHRLLETIRSADSLGSLKPVVEWQDDAVGGFSVITVVTWDRSGLFYKLAGAISAAGMNILKARAISREDHIAIDTFYVSHGKSGLVESEQVRAAFEHSIETILVQGEKALELVREQYELSQKKASMLAQNPFDAAFPVRVDLYFDEELRQIVADYQGKDRIGLLYRVSRTLSKEGLNIDSVRIATNNGIATGTLLLSDENRKRKIDAERLEAIRERLIAILSSENWLAA